MAAMGHWSKPTPREPVSLQDLRILVSDTVAKSVAMRRAWESQERLDDLRGKLSAAGIYVHAVVVRDKSGAQVMASISQTAIRGVRSTAALTAPLPAPAPPGWTLELHVVPPRGTTWTSTIMHLLPQLLALVMLVGAAVYSIVAAYHDTVSASGTAVIPERVRQALDTLAEGLLVMDERERIILANRAFSSTVGVKEETLVGQPVSSLRWLSAYGISRQDFPWNRALRENRPITNQHVRYQLPDGSARILSIYAAPIVGQNKQHRGALVTFRDVTEIEEHRAQLESMLAMLQNSRDEITRKNRELEVLATQDGLTSCLNRRSFFEHFSQAWSVATQRQMPLGCLMVDIDHFKRINDSHGHDVGDQTLRKVASVLRSLFPAPNLVCRYGGEEFCVVVPGLTLEQLQEVADRLREAIAALQINVGKNVLQLTASFGVSELRLGAEDPQSLINQADKALYVAKRTGRNRVVRYHAGMVNALFREFRPTDSAARTNEAQVSYRAVSALIAALAIRDRATADHSRRVANLCVTAAEGLMPHRDVFLLEIAALLHDIGKIGIPDAVLLKSGPLTPEEWAVMGRHEQIGAEIVRTSIEAPEVARIIATHAAHFDGSGRVQGAPAGQMLPLPARLLAIADSFDAMVSDRPYRSGCTPEEAFRELRRCAGVQFDPRLVEHFIKRICESRTPSIVPEAVVSSQLAVELGLRLEALSLALDKGDVSGLSKLAEQIRGLAEAADWDQLEASAVRVQQATVSDEPQLKDILAQTQDLLQLCRAAQQGLVQPGEENAPAEDLIAIEARGASV
jgi:diguanylate cyclase (GGDEF)-like protein/PAS domain S-box-containing protein/putative nucleotidyltransferase with HDIG domain